MGSSSSLGAKAHRAGSVLGTAACVSQLCIACRTGRTPLCPWRGWHRPNRRPTLWPLRVRGSACHSLCPPREPALPRPDAHCCPPAQPLLCPTGTSSCPQSCWRKRSRHTGDEGRWRVCLRRAQQRAINRDHKTLPLALSREPCLWEAVPVGMCGPLGVCWQGK